MKGIYFQEFIQTLDQWAYGEEAVHKEIGE